MVVIGVIALLIAVILPALQMARRQALQTRCAAQQQQLGMALRHTFDEYDFYPVWDDGGAPKRYTWIDVITQIGMIGGGEGSGSTPDGRPVVATVDQRSRLGYCPADTLPEPMNIARHPNLLYPLTGTRGGVDYSYGIGVPLSSGAWAWRPHGTDRVPQPRRLVDAEQHTAERVLAGDGYSPTIYNLSGAALSDNVWNDPTQFDNTIAWGRHAPPDGAAGGANLLFQDGHVAFARYMIYADEPINTGRMFLWHAGEAIDVSPRDTWGANWYPSEPALNWTSEPRGTVIPNEVVPRWYTDNRGWTRISHK